LCYEGAVDLDTIQDINDRLGLEVQIMEFGQIPKQVFTLPHPKRSTSVPNLLYSETLLASPETMILSTYYIFFLFVHVYNVYRYTYDMIYIKLYIYILLFI